tara:strand:+ start:3662 stop:3835 length:174 start_codon:yes stop_codon:yes gene_type:complete
MSNDNKGIDWSWLWKLPLFLVIMYYFTMSDEEVEKFKERQGIEDEVYIEFEVEFEVQ